MKVHNLIQGSPEWLAYRAQHFNASDAPAMMGCSPYKTRAELLRELHTGIAADVDIATQKRFDNGHRAEALARPLAERIVGEDLYPVTGSEGRLSASFDGLTLAETEGFEHKALNAELRAAFASIDALGAHDDAEPGRLLPIYHRVQMEQQLHISGAERILFMASDWTADGELVEERHCWYYPDAELRAAILRGWDQFERDLAAYVPQPRPEKVEAEPMDSLPAVSVRLDGALSVTGNLPSFGQALKAFIARMPIKPATDTEFATCEAACKALKKAEDALDAAEAGALASITDVEAMRRAVADCRKLARDTRLAAEKMVERRKLEIKEEAVLRARRDLDTHIAVVNAEIAPMRLLPVPADFAGAIKGKRSLESMHDALDTTLAAAKIAADAQGRHIRANVERWKAMAEGCEALFPDLHTLVHKSADDFGPLVAARVVQHRAAEAAKIEAAEKRAREQEAARIAEQQRREEAARQAAEAAAKASEQAAAPAPAAVAVQACRPEDRAMLATPAGAQLVKAAAAALADEPATLKLGDICGRLGFTVTAAFVGDTLHIKPAQAIGNRPGLYTESQFVAICRQLQSHVSAMAELYAGEPA